MYRFLEGLTAFLAPTAFCSAIAGLLAVAGPGGTDAWRFFLGGAVIGGIVGIVFFLVWLSLEDEVSP